MKKKYLATLLVSTIILTNAGTVVAVKADDTDSKIAAQDNKIKEIASQQASAQAQVEALQSKVDAILAEQASLNAENERLQAESQSLSQEIQKLAGDIVSRDEALKKQARSAQTDGSATSYINTILDSKSIVDAVSRINAMREIVSANNRMLGQQKADKEAIVEKQKANQEAINVVEANWKKLDDASQELNTQQAALKVAQLNLAAERATAEGEKNALLEQKAAAEAAAREAAAAQAAYQARQAATTQMQQQPVATLLTTGGNVESTVSAAPATEAAAAPAAATYTYDASNTYPVGQCTWGAKQVAPWVGNYWGMQTNGCIQQQQQVSVQVLLHKLGLSQYGLTGHLDTLLS